MVMVEAMIRPQKLDDVREALVKMGVRAMTISEVLGSGRQEGFTGRYRGAEYKVDMIHKVKLEIVSSDEEADEVAHMIADVAHTGEIGDGKVFVMPVREAIRIRTGETGEVALN